MSGSFELIRVIVHHPSQLARLVLISRLIGLGSFKLQVAIGIGMELADLEVHDYLFA